MVRPDQAVPGAKATTFERIARHQQSDRSRGLGRRRGSGRAMSIVGDAAGPGHGPDGS